MDLQPSLQTLGIDDLADITLTELEDKIQHVHPDQLSKQDVLQVFMRWLHERIKKDIQQKSLLSEFANLLLTGGKLQQGPFSEDEVEEALKEWQRKDAEENPADIRRYQMVQLDFHELFEQARSGSKQDKDSSARSTSNQEGNSLVRLNKLINSQDIAEMEIMESTPPWVSNKRKQKTGANEIPLGLKADVRSNIYNEIVKIKEENKRKESLTKANKTSPVKQAAKLSLRDVTSIGASPIKSYEPVISDRYSSLNIPPYLTTPPSSGYTCKRCYQPGHWIQLCPTNLDPKWDQPPPYYYRCEICKVSGRHFATLCPQNEYELSLTQQRLRIKDLPKTPAQEYPHYRDRSPFTPSPRGRSRSPAYHSRRKNHGAHRHDKSPKDRSYNPGGRYQSQDNRRSVSPWTARERMTRESYRKEESPRQYSLSNDRLKERSTTPPRENRKRVKTLPPEERRRPFLDLKKTKKKADEGRLGYDNDEFMGSHISLMTPKDTFLPENRHSGTVENKNELIADAASVSKDTAEDIEKARKEANEFLDALSVEIFLSKTQAPLLTDDMPTNYSTYQLDEMNIDGSKKKDGGLPLQSEAISLFSDRTIPIVHTTREMMEEA
ncbi:hypothetical protein GL218_04187 [Daldinia childiae]|uniref:uncharacterized protein n=1 Tax=Daldinia childiae TaxID=326645 RepID=UPI0014488A80|nr:uncharacterized protein GL218_04187 [Daldinia childiae]KAF3062381.1 hypothetical protein GL218_04187 [Daldinia childiae]